MRSQNETGIHYVRTGPLSFSQEQIWLQCQREPDKSNYNSSIIRRIEGDLEFATLKASFDAVVQRHEIFRSHFLADPVSGVPYQAVMSSCQAAVEFLDVCEDRDPFQRARNEASLELVKPFDIEREIPLRIKVVRFGSRSHLLNVVFHHLASDVWSHRLFLSELLETYERLTSSASSVGNEVSRHIIDHAIWEREGRASEHFRIGLRYWVSQLEGANYMEAIPLDHARPFRSRSVGQSLRIDLPQQLSGQLRLLNAQTKSTPYMALLTAVFGLLFKYSGEVEHTIGMPVANRTTGESKRIFGSLANTLALRHRLTGEMTLGVLLEEIRGITLDAKEFEDIPMESIIRELSAKRDRDRSSLYQVVCQGLEPSEDIVCGSLTLSPISSLVGLNKFDIVFGIGARNATDIRIDYNPDIFEPFTIQRVADHLIRILDELGSERDQCLNDISLTSPSERSEILRMGTTPGLAIFRDATLHEAFTKQAARAPFASAVTSGGANVTYGELENRANSLAHHLIFRGIKNGMLVGICLDKSIDFIVAILGVLKVGAAYVPIDPNYPPDRVEYVLRDSRSRLVISDEKYVELFPTDISCVFMRDCLTQGNELPAPLFQSSANDLAYVIYTSGSTGRPKGVLVTHDGVLSLLCNVQKDFHFSSADVWSLYHSLSFDFSVWELWGALLYGGRVLVVDHWTQRSPEEFYKLVSREEVTVMSQTSSAFHRFIDVDKELALPLSLRFVIFGADTINFSRISEWISRHGYDSPQLIHIYGITETTIFSTYKRISEVDCERGKVNVGRVVSGRAVYVLDERLNPLPVGIVGEIYLGYESVARGYLGNPILTASRFMPNPFDSIVGRRMYKSGDLARFLNNGELELLGRVDRQVKVHGVRVELGEIEQTLNRHPNVRDCAVEVIGEGDKMKLVAFVTCEMDTTLEELREFVGTSLPRNMLPNRVVFVESIPLSQNGKIDRHALREIASARTIARKFLSPRDETEKKLTEAWCEVLGSERVSIDDNFFDLGGDSIRAIAVQSAAKRRGLKFSMESLFAHQTVAELAGYVEVVSSEGGDADLTPFALLSEEDRIGLPDSVVDAYPMTKLQLGMIFQSELRPDEGAYQIVASWHVIAPLIVDKVDTVLTLLTANNPALRTIFDLTSFSEPLQLVHSDNTVFCNPLDISNLGTEEQAQHLSSLLSEMHKVAIDWNIAPLFTYTVVKRSERSFEFILKTHHALIDGWSLSLLFSEFLLAYSNPENAAAVFPKSVARPLAEYVKLERESLTSTRASAFWQRILVGSVPTDPAGLAKNPSRSLRANWDGARIEMTGNLISQIPTSLVSELRALSIVAGTPLKSVLLAVHMCALARITLCDDVVTGLAVDGRPEGIGSENSVGLFINLVPFRTNVRNLTWIDLIRTIFSAERELLVHRRYPMAAMKALSRSQSLYQTSFNFSHFHVVADLKNPLRDIHYAESRDIMRLDLPLNVLFHQDADSMAALSLLYAYDPGLYSPSIISNTLSMYQAALEDCCAFSMESCLYRSGTRD